MAAADTSYGTNGVIYKPPNYNIEEIIGSGSFSEVFRATHTETHAEIALKVFRDKMCTMANYRTAATEIAFLLILEHANVLKLKLYEINRIYAYIGTEFAGFGSLRHYLRNREPVPEPTIKHVMKQVLSALCYLHEMGIFHGDIKPDNILCTNMSGNGPQVKIADFGLSAIKLKGDDTMFYKSGSYMYMAPEVHLRYPVDCTCDLWSAGVLMYIMMFARNIFRVGEQDKDRQMSYLKRRMPPNWFGSEVFSFHCNNLVRSLLSYDKQDRISGKNLRAHPFVSIPDPVIPAAQTFLTSSQEHITTAITYAKEKRYGEALIQGTKAVMKLKIHYNLLEDAEKRKDLKKKWDHYEEFLKEMERALVLPMDTELTCPEDCSPTELRKYLASTPKLLDGYDIGCSAEMFLNEGRTDKALPMFHHALQVLLPLMKIEPKSNRKTILGRRLKKWIEDVERLTGTSNVAQGQAGATSAPVGAAFTTYALPTED